MIELHVSEHLDFEFNLLSKGTLCRIDNRITIARLLLVIT